jgi:hypothetical protein
MGKSLDGPYEKSDASLVGSALAEYNIQRSELGLVCIHQIATYQHILTFAFAYPHQRFVNDYELIYLHGDGWIDGI